MAGARYGGPKVRCLRLRPARLHPGLQPGRSRLERHAAALEDPDLSGSEFGATVRALSASGRAGSASKPPSRSAAGTSTRSSNSTCSASARTKVRPRSGFVTPMALGVPFLPAKPTRSSWMATPSPTPSTTGARTGWCSCGTRRSASPTKSGRHQFAVARRTARATTSTLAIAAPLEPELAASIQGEREAGRPHQLHYRYDGDWGHAQLAGILRDVSFETARSPPGTSLSGYKTSWGLNPSANFNTWNKDVLHLSAVYGRGHRQLHERRRHRPWAAA